jgi:S1-C subfamily serine protease
MHGEQLHKLALRSYVGQRTVKVVGQKGMGSGFFVKAPSGKTFILTNKHVCNTTTKEYIKVVIQPSQEAFESKILQRSEAHDLCLIEAPTDITGLSIASNATAGESVGLIGHPQGWPLTLSRGEILGPTVIQLVTGVQDLGEEKDGFCPEGEVVDIIFKQLCVEDRTATQLFIYSKAGSSGSPLVNFYGSIVGILFAGNPQDQFNSFAVPLYHIKGFLKDK